MLIINKNVRFSIKLSRLWHVCSILVLLESMVYWTFFVAFSQNRTFTTAVHASLAWHAGAGLVFPRKCFAPHFREATAGSPPKWAGRKEQGKRDLSQRLPQDPVCHLFKGNRAPHSHQRTTPSCLCRTISLPSPPGIAYGLCPFNPAPLC